MTALAILLRQSSEGGGGDISGDDDLIGSWARDKIVIVGDYDDSKLYEKAQKQYRDISQSIYRVMVGEGVARDDEETRAFRDATNKIKEIEKEMNENENKRID
jgi:hypothetical protein